MEPPPTNKQIYYQKNKDKIRQYYKEWYKENKELVRQNNSEYYNNNKDYFIQYKSKYYRKNIEYLKQYQKKYRLGLLGEIQSEPNVIVSSKRNPILVFD